MITKEELYNKIEEQKLEIERLKKEVKKEKERLERYKKREEYERVMGYNRGEDKMRRISEYDKETAKGVGRNRSLRVKFREVSCGLVNDNILLNKGVIYSDSLRKTYYGYNKVGNMKVVSRGAIRTRRKKGESKDRAGGYVYGNIFMGYVAIEDVFNSVIEYYFDNEERMKQAGIETNIIKGLYMRRVQKVGKRRGIYRKIVNKYGINVEEVNRKNREKTGYSLLNYNK